MKILYVLSTLSMDGSTISFLNLVNGIRKSNIEVVVVHPKPNINNGLVVRKLTDFGCKCVNARIAGSYNYLGESLFAYIKFILLFFLSSLEKLF